LIAWHRRLGALGAALGALALAAATAGPGSTHVPASSAAVRVVDRTLLCAADPIGGGLNEVQVRAQAGIRQSARRWRSLASVVVTTGRTGSRTALLDRAFGWAGAGAETGGATLGMGDDSYLYTVHDYGSFATSRQLCRADRRRVPLTAKGLDGGPAGQLGDFLECQTPARVLVRLRAVFAAAAPVYGERGFLKSKGTVREAFVAIRTQTGRPIAFAAAFQSGKARLFTAPACSS
jgi:hypothetical protein